MMPCWSKSNISYVCFYEIYLYGNIFLVIYHEFWGQLETEIFTHAYFMDVWVYFSFPLSHKFVANWLEKCYPIDKFNKSTRWVCLIYSLIAFSMAPFIDNIKFPLWNLNINNLMLINFHISLITKQFFRSFDRHSDKIVTLSELLQDKTSTTSVRQLWMSSESLMSLGSKLYELLL